MHRCETYCRVFNTCPSAIFHRPVPLHDGRYGRSSFTFSVVLTQVLVYGGTGDVPVQDSSGRSMEFKLTDSRLSGKAMARTGLRMMPTFPLPPLKFRTAGFPRYGFKGGLSDGGFPAGGPHV